MNFQKLDLREQIVKTMRRIYDFGMTTTSGGNISCKDEEGNIWITPGAVDKGTLRPRDIIKLRPDGTFEGLHKPSLESPFHVAIYNVRPDIKAIVHAHPPALVSFSIVRKVPDTSVIPQANQVCGKVGYSKYELPGSEELGQNISKIYEQGYHCVLMENHGTVVGGEHLSDAFKKFETLEFCARTILEGSAIGKVQSLNPEQIQMFSHGRSLLSEFDGHIPSTEEKNVRGELCEIVKRAYRQQLIISTYGTFSSRVSKEEFLITPYGKDRYYLDEEDFVLIRNGECEEGKVPSRSVRLHMNIYREFPEINCVLSTQSPFATAYCITGQTFDTRTIPESYILLREIPLVPFGDQFEEGDIIINNLRNQIPIMLIENDTILVTGQNILETFDRLEVAEFSARSLTQSVNLGEMVPMNDKDIEDIKRKFLSGK